MKFKIKQRKINDKKKFLILISILMKKMLVFKTLLTLEHSVYLPKIIIKMVI